MDPLQITGLVLIGITVLIAIGWTICAISEKEVSCPDESCFYNCKSTCYKGSVIDLRAVTLEGYKGEVLVCNSYKEKR